MINHLFIYSFVAFICFFSYKSVAQTKKDPKFYKNQIIEIGLSYGGRYYDEEVEPNLIVVHSDELTATNFRYLYQWSLNKKIYWGIGSGYDFMKVKKGFTAKTVIINGQEEIERTETPGTTYHFIPIFGQARYYFRNKPESAFLTADIGSFFKLDNNEGKPRLFWGLGFGQRYKINSANAISWGIDYHEHYLFRKKQGFNEPNENPRIASLAIKIGLLF